MKKILLIPAVVYILFSVYSLTLSIGDFFALGRYSRESTVMIIKILSIAYFLIAVFFAILAYGVFKRKRWAYWANLLVFILSVFSLPLSISILIPGFIVGLNKK